MWQWCFSLAVVLQVYWGIHWLWALLLFSFLPYFLLSQRRVPIYALLSIVVGMVWAWAYSQYTFNHWLPQAWEGQTLSFQGQVEAFTWREGKTHYGAPRYTVTVGLQELNGKSYTGRVVLGYYPSKNEAVTALQGGDQIHGQVKLKRPRGMVNEGQLSQSQLDFARRVVARGTLTTLEHRAANLYTLDHQRERLSAYLRHKMAHWPLAKAYVPALLVADRRHLDDQQWQLFRESGTAHLMSISGLHISLVAGLAWLLARWSLVWFVPGSQIAQRLALVPALLAAASYAALAGFSLPTQRALIMCAAMSICLWQSRSYSLFYGFRWACFLVLLFRPLSALDPSFWLSFSAVGVILLFVYVGRQGFWWRTQVALSFAVGALGSAWFGAWGILAPLANLVLIPLFAWGVVPLAFLMAIPINLDYVAQGLEFCLVAAQQWLSLLSPWQWQLQAPASTLSLLLLCAAIVLACLPRLPFPRFALFAALLPILWPQQAKLPAGDFDFITFDVGQGLASAIRTQQHILIYDTGPKWGAGSAGESIVLPWLKQQPQTPSIAMISHGDSDHSGGMEALAKQWPQMQWLSGEPDRLPSTQACFRGQQWQWDGVQFDVLWPPAGFIAQQHNNVSCVVLVQGDHGNVLLTGDIQRPVEFWLAKHQRFPSQTILQVPHHGSSTSSSYALLRAVEPEAAVAGVGYGNAFGHPTPEIKHRYRTLEIPFYSTANNGMIVFHLRGLNKLQPQLWRSRRKRLWLTE